MENELAASNIFSDQINKLSNSKSFQYDHNLEYSNKQSTIQLETGNNDSKSFQQNDNTFQKLRKNIMTQINKNYKSKTNDIYLALKNDQKYFNTPKVNNLKSKISKTTNTTGEQINQSEYDKLIQRNNQLAQENFDLNNKYANLKTDLINLKKDNEFNIGKIENKSQQDLQEKTVKINQLRNDILLMNSNIGKLTSENESLNLIIEDLKNLKNNINDELKNVKNNLNHIEKENIQLVNQIDFKSNEITELNNKLNVSYGEIDKYKIDFKTMFDEVANYRDYLDKVRIREGKVNQKYSDTKLIIEQLENEIKDHNIFRKYAETFFTPILKNLNHESTNLEEIDELAKLISERVKTNKKSIVNKNAEFIDACSKCNQIEILNLLLTYDIDLEQNGPGATLVNYRTNCINILSNLCPILAQIFIKAFELDLNQKNEFGNTPLHQACQKGYLNLSKCIIDSGNVNPNLRGNKRKTALHFAAIKNQTKIVQMMIEKGCKIDIFDEEGNTVKDILVNSKDYGLDEISSLKDIICNN